MYGDSIGDFFYRAIFKRPLCKNVFSRCNRTYNWVYNIQDDNLTNAKTENDDNDFSIDKIITELKAVLVKPELDHNSALLHQLWTTLCSRNSL